MMNVKYGTFQMLKPIWSRRISGYLVGAIVGAERGMAYTKRVADANSVPQAIEELRMQIMRDHPGIVETEYSDIRKRRLS
jgi:hypothetical protein